MNNTSLSQYEEEVLSLFINEKQKYILPPKSIDNQLFLGIEKVIDIFLDLEVKGCIEWLTLDLMQLELGRSTKEIYEEIYNSKAKLTKYGQHLIENYTSYKKVA